MFSLFIDEDSDRRAFVLGARRIGFDCLTVSEAGRKGLSDEEHLAFAAAEGRVIYTRNTRDFVRLNGVWHQVAKRHSGIVVVGSRGHAIGLQLRALQNMAGKLDAKDMENRLEFLLNYA